MSESNEKYLDALLKCKSVSSCVIPDSPIIFSNTAWTPDAICKINNKDTLVCIHSVDDEIPHFLIKRLLATETSDYQVLIITGYKILRNLEHFKKLLKINSLVSFYGYQSELMTEPENIALAVAKSNIKVKRELLLYLLELSRNAETSWDKGKRFEQLLCLFFSQIEDFHIFSSNYRTETEEIDVVIQIRESCSTRCWARFEAPYIFIEAKNQASKVGQRIISTLIGILSVKGFSTKLGITISMNGFTADAKTQALRNSDAQKKIILLTADEIDTWIQTGRSLDDQLEQRISEALID